MPNQLNIKNRGNLFIFIGIVMLFAYTNICEFDKNANSINVLVYLLPFILNWFGDYRSLRFLCGYFGSRTFYFKEAVVFVFNKNKKKRGKYYV